MNRKFYLSALLMACTLSLYIHNGRKVLIK